MSVAQDFFVEREYKIPGATGAEYIEGLKSLLANANTLDQGNLFQAPFDEGDIRYFFRGQTNGTYGLNSSLYRAVRGKIKPGHSPKYVEKLMSEAEERVILNARSQGIGRNLTALELLTVLQHHLIPTRLIDISASWPVGLYFASESMDGIDGRLFVIAMKPSLWGDFSRSDGEMPQWPAPAEHRWQQTTWPILLPFTDPRMIAQQGYFMAGGLATNIGGHHQYWKPTAHHPLKRTGTRKHLTQKELREVSTLMIKFPVLRDNTQNPLDKLEAGYKGTWTAVALTIPVPAALKSQIREELKTQFNIDKDSIYPPIDESSRLLKLVAGGDF